MSFTNYAEIFTWYCCMGNMRPGACWRAAPCAVICGVVGSCGCPGIPCQVAGTCIPILHQTHINKHYFHTSLFTNQQLSDLPYNTTHLIFKALWHVRVFGIYVWYTLHHIIRYNFFFCNCSSRIKYGKYMIIISPTLFVCQILQ